MSRKNRGVPVFSFPEPPPPPPLSVVLDHPEIALVHKIPMDPTDKSVEKIETTPAMSPYLCWQDPEGRPERTAGGY